MDKCREEFEKWMKENGFDDIQFRLILLAAWQAAWNARVPDVDWLSNVIRQVGGNNSLGAGALAEKIVEAMKK